MELMREVETRNDLVVHQSVKVDSVFRRTACIWRVDILTNKNRFFIAAFQIVGADWHTSVIS